MKKTIFALVLTGLCLCACDGFLTKNPTNSIPGDLFMETASDVELYSNGMLNSYLPSFSEISGGNDEYTDLVATKSGNDFFAPGIWDSSRQSGWGAGDWTFVRRANYFIANLPKAESALSSDEYGHYMGEARFWRGYAHFSKLRNFGDIPWIDHLLTEEDEDLFAGREDREYVIHKILEDLTFATQHCLANQLHVTPGRTRLNKWVVLSFYAKVCLFEASFRRYHTVNPSTGKPWNNKYESVEELYSMCADACKEIIESGVFSLHRTNDPSTAFSELFLSEVIPSEEAIWARQASETASVMHNRTEVLTSATAGQRTSPTKELVDMYLTLSGTPVASRTISPNSEFEDRDNRLLQTVIAPGHTWLTKSGVNELKGPSFTTSLTGYAFSKWIIEKEENYSTSRDNNSMAVYRYAGTLLDYAEAKAELGEMDEDIWNMTVGALRQRAGVRNIYPLSADFVRDDWLTDYYNSISPIVLDDVMIEIRRERATELVMEMSNRYWDLMRWGCGEIIVRRYNYQGWRGIYLTENDVNNGFDFNGISYQVTFGGNNTSRSYPITSTHANVTWSLSEGTHGYLIYNYAQQWDDKMYVRPIPLTAITLNPALGQNYGWE